MFVKQCQIRINCLYILAVVWAILSPIDASYATKNEENIIIRESSKRRFLIGGQSPSSTQWSSWEQYAACQTTCVPGYEDATRACCLIADNHRCLSLPWDTLRPRIGTFDGSWSDWSEWTACSATCGGGASLRTRQCIYPVEFMHGASCNGSSALVKTCEMQQCAHAEVDGTWSSWSSWSPCTTTCGAGFRQRGRNCIYPNGADHGLYCSGMAFEITGCTQLDCPLDIANGTWSEWSPWSHCSASCDQGFRQRSRSCEYPHGSTHGHPCNGSLVDVNTCNDGACLHVGNWQPWEQWSSCDATCGLATRTRQRSCNDSASCPRQDVMNETCGFTPCPDAYSWLPWGQWSSCSATCGEASRMRQRSCNDTSSYPSPCNDTSSYPSPCNDTSSYPSPCNDTRSYPSPCNDTSSYPSPCTGQDIMNETCNLPQCPENTTCKAQTSESVWFNCNHSAFLVTDPDKVSRIISSEKCIFKGATLPEFNRMTDQQIKDKLEGCQFTSQMTPSELYLIKNSGLEACRYIRNSMGKIDVVRETDMSRCPPQSFLICERTHQKSSEFDQWFATKSGRNVLLITSATGNYSQCHTICSSLTGRANATLAAMRVVLSYPDTLPPPDTGFTSLWADHSGVANSSCSIIQDRGNNRMQILGNSDCSQAGHCVCDANAKLNCS